MLSLLLQILFPTWVANTPFLLILAFLYRKNASSYPYFHKEKMVENIHIMRLVFYNHAEIANVYF
ncbi:hypothetical protein AAU33_09370 [Listeria monocytogenes]|nr:hypothetical protein [Listeria monocytogenes]